MSTGYCRTCGMNAPGHTASCRPRASQAAHAATMPRGPYDRWLVAGTPMRDRYPCRCNGTRECGRRCWCRGRLDGAEMPAVCCARRTVETTGRQAGE